MDPFVSSGRSRGFSLIEIAVVVAIMMTLLTLGLGLMNAQVNSSAVTVTKKRQEAIKDALIAYLGANKRLPCPYVPTSGTTVTGQAPAPACAGIGIVPFATLGLGRDIAEDGWGNFFSYRVYADAPTPTCPGPGWDWSNSDCFGEGKDGSNPSKTALTINDGTVASPTSLFGQGVAVVAVVISHGANGLGAWAAQGTRNAAATTCEEAHNTFNLTAPSGCTLTANTFYRGEQEGNDDVVAYLTAGEALQTLVKQGAIKSAAAQVSEDLQQLFENAVDAKLKKCSSSLYQPPFPSSPLDPWGEPYNFPPSNSIAGDYSSNNSPIKKTINEATLTTYCNRVSSS
jgi:type II secretory pathway pseudopilin PulG